MAYSINKFNGQQLIVLEDGTIDTSTSLGLVGRNYVGYGETQNENFVFLLENFANNNPPSRPLTGQIWFNTTDNVANAYDGENWNPIGSAKLSNTAPTNANAGSLWLDTNANQLKIWTGTEWGFIGPEAVAGFGITRARSVELDDSNGNPQPVIILEADDTAIAICTSSSFTINPSSAIAGFSNNLITGINLSNTARIKGDITGNAGSADRLLNPRLINNAAFDGQNNITIKASTTNKLVKGTYITGSDFDGSSEVTWAVDATPSNVIGKVVARNSAGGFSAGTITADFVGDLTGNVTASTGTSTFNTVRANTFIGATLTGNAYSASQLATPRRINGVNFDGSSDITVTAAAGTLTGNTLSDTVTQSSLTAVGTLSNLSVADTGISIGSSGQLRFLVEVGNAATIRSNTGAINFDLGSSGPDVNFISADKSLLAGGPNAPAIFVAKGSGANNPNLGLPAYPFDRVYATRLVGDADTATLATTATNIAGGGQGSIPYQTSAGTTTMLGLGTAGYVLKAQASGIGWEAANTEQLNKGSYINLINTTTSGSVDYFNAAFPATISVDATSSNTVSKIVARDSSGNFSAGTITASLNGSVKGNIISSSTSGVVLNTSAATAVFTGNMTGDVTGDVSGNAGSATKLATARTINGVSFDGTANITVGATDTSKVALAGDTMTGRLTLSADPTDSLHAATKQYVDNSVGGLPATLFDTFTTGVKSPLPTTFPERTIRGFAAYNSTDFPGAYYGGITVNGPNDVYSGQIAFNWNSEEAAPSGLYFRVNDDTGTTSEWSAWQQVSTTAQLDGKVNLSGGTMTGYLTLAANPTNNLHAATKQYVDSNATYTFSYGHSYVSEYSNIVNAFNYDKNYFDVFPPSGKTMSNLVAFIPSIRSISFAGGVNGDDTTICYALYWSDRIRVRVGNTEQRDYPGANYLAIWR